MKLDVLRFLIVSLACAAAFVVITGVRAQTFSPDQKYFPVSRSAMVAAKLPATADAFQEKTAGQARTNIKLLNDLPDSQLIPVMNYFAASMGRRCNYCHVNNNGQWDYAADTKPEKNTAREMIKLVLNTNKTLDQLKLDPIACYTCHRGRNSPQSIPVLPLPVPSPPPGNPAGAGEPGAPGAQPQASPSPRPSPPAPEALIAKYVDAIGGQAAIDKIKNRVMKGTLTTANGNTGTYEAIQTPDKGYESFVTARGSLERAVNGATGWEKNPQGVRALSGQDLANLKLSMQLFRNLKLKEQYASLRFTGRDKIGDRDALIVLGTTPDKKRERLFFDAQNGLLLRRISYTETMIGTIPEQIDFEDYRVVEGVKLPFMVRVSSVDAGNPYSIRTVTEIKLNTTIDESKFNMPAAAKP